MSDYFKVMGLVLLLVFSVAFVGFFGNLIGLGSYAFFAPKIEQVRYNTFKESQTYNDGMLRDLQELKMQYLTANDDQKAALRAITLQRFSVYPTDRLPADLQSFYLTLRGN